MEDLTFVKKRIRILNSMPQATAAPDLNLPTDYMIIDREGTALISDQKTDHSTTRTGKQTDKTFHSYLKKQL